MSRFGDRCLSLRIDASVRVHFIARWKRYQFSATRRVFEFESGRFRLFHASSSDKFDRTGGRASSINYVWALRISHLALFHPRSQCRLVGVVGFGSTGA